MKIKAVKEFVIAADPARRLQTMPGVGTMTALAVAAFAPDKLIFSRGLEKL